MSQQNVDMKKCYIGFWRQLVVDAKKCYISFWRQQNVDVKGSYMVFGVNIMMTQKGFSCRKNDLFFTSTKS